jgi:Arc/MetJ family transcription regulator
VEVDVARTTILVRDDLLLEVKRVARTQGLTVTDVVNSALRAYVAERPPAGLPSFTAVSRNAASRTAGRQAKNLARVAVDPYEGSSREGRR